MSNPTIYQYDIILKSGNFELDEKAQDHYFSIQTESDIQKDDVLEFDDYNDDIRAIIAIYQSCEFIVKWRKQILIGSKKSPCGDYYVLQQVAQLIVSPYKEQD